MVYFIKIHHVLQTVCCVFRKNPTSVINCLLLLNKKGPENNQGPFFWWVNLPTYGTYLLPYDAYLPLLRQILYLPTAVGTNQTLFFGTPYTTSCTTILALAVVILGVTLTLRTFHCKTPFCQVLPSGININKKTWHHSDITSFFVLFVKNYCICTILATNKRC
jgi:hypothetical protein